MVGREIAIKKYVVRLSAEERERMDAMICAGKRASTSWRSAIRFTPIRFTRGRSSCRIKRPAPSTAAPARQATRPRSARSSGCTPRSGSWCAQQRPFEDELRASAAGGKSPLPISDVGPCHAARAVPPGPVGWSASLWSHSFLRKSRLAQAVNVSGKIPNIGAQPFHGELGIETKGFGHGGLRLRSLPVERIGRGLRRP